MALGVGVQRQCNGRTVALRWPCARHRDIVPRQQRVQCTAPSASEATALDVESFYVPGAPAPPEHAGPIRVERMPARGGGRGVCVTETLAAGDLVLVSRPMAYVTSEFGTLPEVEELVASTKCSDLSANQRALLLDLHAGDDIAQEDGDVPGSGATEVVTEERLYGIIGCNSFGEEFTDFASSLARAPPPERSPQQQQQQPGGGGPVQVQVGHLGLWHSFSMLNHSCCPNAVNYVVGDSMCVFAAGRVEQGSELLINYLGAASLRPVEERQAGLAEAYAFSCSCPRCSLELLHGCSSSSSSSAGSMSVSEELQVLLGRCTDRAAELQDILAGPSAPPTPGDQLAALTGLCEQAAADLAAAEALMTPAPQLMMQLMQTQQAGPGQAMLWLRAAAYEMYSQRTAIAEAAARCMEAAEAQGAAAAEATEAAAVPSSGAAELTERLWAAAAGALESQLGLVAAVAPHSDLHLFLATKALALAQAAEGRARAREGAGQQSAAAEQVVGSEAALARCCAVVRGRYGRQLSDGTVQRLLEGAAVGLSQVAV